MKLYIPCMNRLLMICLLFAMLASGCNAPDKPQEKLSPTSELKAKEPVTVTDSVETGRTYLPVYSQIYQRTERLTFDLTITVSIRNMNHEGPVYLHKIEYFDTKGIKVEEFLNQTISLAPYETVEIVIEGQNIKGGTGDNFVVDWSVPVGQHIPLVQGVMISTAGQQGISFVTNGVRLK